MWRTFLSRLLLPCQSPHFVPLIVLLSLMVNHVSASLRFVMLSSDFFYMWRVIGICNTCFSVMLLVWCIWDKQFVVDYVFCDVVCGLFFCLFLLVAIILFVIVHFAMIAFLLDVFVHVVPLFFFPGFLLTFFLDMSGFVIVMAFYDSSIFYCACISHKLFRYPCVVF